MLEFKPLATFSGPSPYSSDPVVVARLVMVNAEQAGLSVRAANMAKVFVPWWPGTERRDGESEDLFIARFLTEWALAALNEVAGAVHACGVRKQDDAIVVWLGYHRPELSLAALQLGAALLFDIARDVQWAERASKAVESFWKDCKKSHPDYQAKILMDAARASDLPYWPFIASFRYWQFGWGSRSLKFFESCSEEDSLLGSQISRNKSVSKAYLDSMGAPVAKHVMVASEDDLEAASKQIGWPCVVKPVDRGQAKGVTVNIRDAASLQRAFAIAREHSRSRIMIESYIEGDVHRLLVVRGRFVAATRRVPAHVTGDGQSTVMELAGAFNDARTEHSTPGSYRGPAPFDAEFDATLSAQGLTRESVPPHGEKVRLRNIPLLGTGADNEDVTAKVHPDIAGMAEAMAETLGLQIAGFDYITADVSRSYVDGGAFLEFNLTPSLRGHLVDGRDVAGVAKAILGPQPARIPSALVVASEPTIDTLRQASLAEEGLGWRTPKAAGVGAIPLLIEGGKTVGSVLALLSNKKVQRILVVCTPEELAQHGMLLDKVDLVVADFDALEPEWAGVLRDHAHQAVSLPQKADLAQMLSEKWPGAAA